MQRAEPRPRLKPPVFAYPPSGDTPARLVILTLIVYVQHPITSSKFTNNTPVLHQQIAKLFPPASDI